MAEPITWWDRSVNFLWLMALGGSKWGFYHEGHEGLEGHNSKSEILISKYETNSKA